MRRLPETTRSVTVEFEGDEAKVAAHLERDLKMFKALRRDARLALERHHGIASPSPPGPTGPPDTSALIAACAGRRGGR